MQLQDNFLFRQLLVFAAKLASAVGPAMRWRGMLRRLTVGASGRVMSEVFSVPKKQDSDLWIVLIYYK